MISPDGKIKVYEANSPQQCIILGRGQTFCISQPGNRMWQSYRDRIGHQDVVDYLKSVKERQ
jgi:hypothetical protein